MLGIVTPVMATQDIRTGCDSCVMQVNNLDKPFKMVGTWLFTRDDAPGNKDINIDTSAWRLVKTPGPWKKVYNDGKYFTVGWYRGTFEFAPSLIGQEAVILVDTYTGRLNVYLDGSEIYRRPGNINIDRYYSNQPIPVRFKITKQRHNIAFRVDTVIMTGIYQLPFEIRKYDINDTSIAWRAFWGGEVRMIAAYVILFFGFFFLLVYFKTKYSLYLVASLGSIVLFPYLAAIGDPLLKVFPPEKLLFIHYSGFIAVFLAYIFSQYFYKFTPKLNWFLGVIYLLSTAGIMSNVFQLNMHVFQLARTVLFLTNLLLAFFCCYMFYKGIRQKKSGAGVLMIGMLFFVATGYHDNFLAFGLINSTQVMFFGMTMWTFSMLYVASNIFANTFVENRQMAKELKVMNEHLEDLVTERTKQLRQKTNDIQSMLQNMPQGVLTILEGNIIHPEYSAFLETIFETKEIAGKNMMELVFTDTNLGSDILSQVEVAADTCIGEDKMNFEFNTHLMVTEFDKKMPDGKIKSLELSWSPICDEKETIEKIMLCVRDVTELKQLAAEANKQKRELEIIGEILSVNQEKFHEFIDNSRQFISQNESIIKKAGKKETETVSLLFRNMHTIKGNSRTYGLLNLTNMIHETEQGYDELRKNPDAQWKPDTLLAKLSEASALIEEYAKINDVKLGRKGPGRRGRVEKFLLVEKVQIAQSLQMLEAVDKTNIAALRDAVRDVGNTLKLIGTERIREILSGIVDSMPSLAKELGKEPPAISIEDHDIAIRNQGSGLIKNIFMHIFRNSIDHGLEKAQARVAQGKNPVGNIRLEVSVEEGHLWFKMRDDGRGLAMGRIRQRAIENKLMTEGEKRSAEELAQFVLLPGFSTAEIVTEVSGRGVGMDAVKAFLKDEGGKLEIRFLDANDTADFRTFEVIISLPDKFALQVDG